MPDIIDNNRRFMNKALTLTPEGLCLAGILLAKRNSSGALAISLNYEICRSVLAALARALSTAAT